MGGPGSTGRATLAPAGLLPLFTRPALALGGVVLAAGLSLARQPGLGAFDTVYAEDGSVFLADAYARSTVDALTTPYAGYLHTGPRLLAELVALLPVGSAAAGLAILASLTTAALALLVFVASGDHFRTVLPRLMVASVTVLVPLGQDELPNSIANLHWPALYAMFWLLLWRPGKSGRIGSAVLVGLITLSDVLTAVFLPLVLWRWWRHRDRADLPLIAAYGAGLLVQATAMLHGSGSGRELAIDAVHWAPWWVLRAVPPGLLGERWTGSTMDGRWLAVAALAWLLLAGLVVLLVQRHSGLRNLHRAAPLASVALLHSVALFALPTILSGIAPPRYAAAPAMLLTAALLLATFPATPRTPTTAMPPQPGDLARIAPPMSGIGVLLGRLVQDRVMQAGVAVGLALVWTVNLSVANSRALGPSWIDGLDVARAECGRADVALIPVSPNGADWSVAVPCRLLIERVAR